MEKSSRKKDYIYCGIIIILVVILSLVSCSRIGKVDNDKPSTPTGNTEVFNIGINCSCKEPDGTCDNNGKENNTDNNTNNKTNNNGNNIINKKDQNNNDIPVYNPETDDKVLDKVFVDDVNGDYIYQNKLDIFNNPA